MKRILSFIFLSLTAVSSATAKEPIRSPETAELHCDLASIYLKHGHLEQALEHLAKAEELKPTYSAIFELRTQVFERHGEMGRALEEVDKAIRISPGSSRAHFFRGAILRYQQRPEEAIASLSKAIALYPDPNFYCERSVAYRDLGKFQTSLGDATRALELAVRMHSAAECRARCLHERAYTYGNMKRLGNAIADATEAIELAPTSDDYYGTRALLFSMDGQLDRALEDFDRAIHLNPEDAIHYQGRSVVLRLLGRHDESKRDKEKFRQLEEKQRRELEEQKPL